MVRVASDDKKRARLNLISHFLARVPYKEISREKPKLPKRQDPGDYKDPDYPFKYIPELF